MLDALIRIRTELLDGGKAERLGMGRVCDQTQLHKYVRKGFMSKLIIMGGP